MADILLVGGGTAGHVLPAIATADALRRMRPDLTVAFAGLPGSIEERLVGGAGHAFHTIEAAPLPRRPSWELLRVVPRLLRSVRVARTLLSREEVRAVVSFGGYVALPVALAARSRLPLVLHEQNSRPGLANRLASRTADQVAVTFASTASELRTRGRVHVTGNPVQGRLRDLDVTGRRPGARTHLGLDPMRPTVLAFGGSQGARSINRAVAGAAAAWRALGVQVVHVTGRVDHSDAVGYWRAMGVEPDVGPVAGPNVATEVTSGTTALPRVRAVPFLDDMADAYAAADVVIGRAGATSIAELTVLGLPAVLVPYPHATAQHQQGNAEALRRAGAAVVIDDAELTPDALAVEVASILGDPARVGAMTMAARSWGRPEAAEALALLVLEAAEPDRA